VARGGRDDYEEEIPEPALGRRALRPLKEAAHPQGTRRALTSPPHGGEDEAGLPVTDMYENMSPEDWFGIFDSIIEKLKAAPPDGGWEYLDKVKNNEDMKKACEELAKQCTAEQINALMVVQGLTATTGSKTFKMERLVRCVAGL
jgi:hypothetical protein